MKRTTRFMAMVWFVCPLCFEAQGQISLSCDSLISLTDLDRRLTSAPSSGLTDRYISEGWYKIDSPYTLLTSNPGQLAACGTTYPVWVNDTLPVADGIHALDACVYGIYGPCADKFSIDVSRCNDEHVFYLAPTPYGNSAYCLQLQKQFVSPSWTPDAISVNYSVDYEVNAHSLHVPKLNFKCIFTPLDASLFYKIYWYISNVLIHETNFVNWTGGIYNDTALKEDLLLELGYKLNIDVSCAVVAAHTAEGVPGNITTTRSFFAGIIVHTPVIEVKRGQSTQVLLEPTVPFSCSSITDSTGKCPVGIIMSNPDVTYDTCVQSQISVLAGQSHMCGTQIYGYYLPDLHNWKTNSTMTILHKDPNTNYDLPVKTFTLQLKVDSFIHQRIWSETSLQDIKVNIYEDDSVWKSKKCYGRSDPHMLTFDGNLFELHTEGIYIMYKHLYRNIQIQIKTAPCHDRNPRIFCICGIVIQAGLDVFVIHRCKESTNGRATNIAEFMQCGDGVLKAYNPYGSFHRIYLPTGTTVEVDNRYGKNLEVFIYPTIHDVNTTVGLCATLDGTCGNDFKLKDGGYDSSVSEGHGCIALIWWQRPRPNTYNEDWKISESDSLFPYQGAAERYDQLSPWPDNLYLCYCPNDIANPPEAISVCGYEEYADCIDNRDGENRCLYRSFDKRSVDSLKSFEEGFTTVSKNPKRPRFKRSTETSYTTIEAEAICNETFSSSEALQACSLLGLLDDYNFEYCVWDITETGLTDWGAVHREAAVQICTREISYNDTLKETKPDLTEIILENTCVNECSNHGVCNKGNCTCDIGYGEKDCSVKVSDPPPIHISLQGTFCDKSSSTCDKLDLYGERFMRTRPPICKIVKANINKDNEIISQAQSSKDCEWVNEFRTECLIETARKRRDVDSTFVTSYTYSVSNDGINFGTTSTMYVYDTTCQQFSNDSSIPTFTLKTGYCFIDGTCIQNGIYKPTDSCRLCKSDKDQYDYSSGCTEETSPETRSVNTTLAVGIGVGAALTVIIVVVKVMLYKTKHNSKRHKVNTRILNVQGAACEDTLSSDPDTKTNYEMFSAVPPVSHIQPPVPYRKENTVSSVKIEIIYD